MAEAWRSASIAGKPADVYDPAGTAQPRFGILYLHDSCLDTLRGREVFTRLMDELDLACVCPLGGQCWWTDRVCPEFDSQLTPERHILDNIVPFFAARWQLAPPRIALLGVSMGGQGALRLAFKYPRLFPAVAAIASALDYHELYGQGTPLDVMYDSKEQCRQDTALMYVPPTNYPPHIFYCIDPDDESWYRGNDRLHEKLTALGVPHAIDLTTRGGGHSWTYFNRMAERSLRFVHDGLVQESRRLL
jgi:S-formylglutathione hydrolase